MLQIALQKPGEFVQREVPEPIPAGGEALVRVHRIGVCGTDWHAFAGRQPFFNYPRVLGHELGVEVVSVPENARGIRVGSHCAIEPYLYCGICSACLAGKTNCCLRLQTLGVHTDGGMQPLFTIPVHLLHPSATLSLEQLALVETLGIGAQAVRRSQLQPQETALVVGTGPIGLATLQFARATGATVRIIEPGELRRQFAAQFQAETMAQWDGQPADVVFDATGNQASMEKSFDFVAQAGRLVFVGLVLGRIAFDDPSFHRREMTLLASRNSAGLFPQIIRMIEQGAIDTSPWISHRFQLREVPEKFPAVQQQPNLVKAVICVD